MSKEKSGIGVKFKNFLTKFKKIKHIEVAIAIILGCVVLIVFIGSITKKSSGKVEESQNQATVASSISEYSKSVEERLTIVLSAIKGVGKVNVFVSVDATPEIIIAEEIEEKTVTTGGTSTKTINRTPVLIKNGSTSTTIVLLEKAPKITGVLVVAEGASDARIKVDLINAIKALFEIDSNKIEIISG